MTTKLIAALGCFLVLALTYGGCKNASDTNDPVTPSGATLTMQKLSDLPRNGGAVSSVDFLDDQTLVAIIDGTLATIPVGGGAPDLHTGDGTNFTTVCVGASKELYLLTGTELWVKSDISAAPVKSTVFSRTPQTLEVHLNVLQNGQAYLRVRTYPSAMQMWTSTNKGQSWVRVKLPTDSDYGGGFAMGSSGEAYASSPNEFYSSSDSGLTWASHPAVKLNYGGELLVRKNGDVLYYIPGGGGIWISSNKGQSFSNYSPFNASPFFQSIVESADGVLYAMASGSSSPAQSKASKLLRSTDGKTWSDVIFAEGSALAMRGPRIAVGMSAGVSGGLALSQDNGQNFFCTGTKTVSDIKAIGWNAASELCLFADHWVFVQTTAGWKTYGASVSFADMCSSGDGRIYLIGSDEAYITATSGKSWTSVAMPAKILSSGTGYYAIPTSCGLRLKDALVSVTYYRTDLQKHTNGQLIRIGSEGSILSTQKGLNFIWLAESASNLIYGTTDNFRTNQQSLDAGLSWKEVSTKAPGFVFNSAGKYIGYGSGSTYIWGNIASTNTATMTLNGFSSQSNYITSARFDINDKLYLLTSDQGLFISSQSWR